MMDAELFFTRHTHQTKILVRVFRMLSVYA